MYDGLLWDVKKGELGGVIMNRQKAITKANLLSEKIDKIFLKHDLKVKEVRKNGTIIINQKKKTK